MQNSQNLQKLQEIQKFKLADIAKLAELQKLQKLQNLGKYKLCKNFIYFLKYIFQSCKNAEIATLPQITKIVLKNTEEQQKS